VHSGGKVKGERQGLGIGGWGLGKNGKIEYRIQESEVRRKAEFRSQKSEFRRKQGKDKGSGLGISKKAERKLTTTNL
jgi:hypothetical protein